MQYCLFLLVFVTASNWIIYTADAINQWLLVPAVHLAKVHCQTPKGPCQFTLTSPVKNGHVCSGALSENKKGCLPATFWVNIIFP